MSILLNGDCLEEMKGIDDNSVDFIFCDLPYGATSCKWDVIIPWEPFWKEILRIKKINTPIFFTTTTKFGFELINNAPKKCPFRYDLVWLKSQKCGFLSSKRMPLRSHEMVYVFYEKLPFYDLSSHTHKFIKTGEEGEAKHDGIVHSGGEVGKGNTYGQDRKTPLKRCKKGEAMFYDPPLPTTMLEIKSTRGKHSTEKPVALMEWLLKYYSKEGDVVLDPTMGSGSTGVACKNMNRNFIGIEKDPEIYESAVNRIEDD